MRARTTIPAQRVPGYPGAWLRSTNSARSVFHAIAAPSGESLCGSVTLDSNRSQKASSDSLIGHFGACDRCCRILERGSKGGRIA